MMPLGLSEGKDAEGGSVATEGLSAKDWLEPAFTEIQSTQIVWTTRKRQGVLLDLYELENVIYSFID